FEVGAHFRGDLVADVAIFFEGFVEDTLEFGRRAGIQGDGSYRRAVQDVVKDDGAGAARERELAGGQLIEDAAEREEIASSVEFLAARLFRRHVGDGADGGAGAGEQESFGIAESRAVEAGMMFGEKLGETKIEDFDGAAFGDENVGGLDVAMEDALFVGGVESVGELDAD